MKPPVASAVPMAIDPARYTIIGVRALEWLGAEGSQTNLKLYLAYFAFCRALAIQAGTPQRTLDRILWQWSKKNGTTDIRDEES